MSGSNKLLRELFREELDHLGFGPHGVVDIPNTFYTLHSGERLALREGLVSQVLSWIQDDQVIQQSHFFYGLSLGLCLNLSLT